MAQNQNVHTIPHPPILGDSGAGIVEKKKEVYLQLRTVYTREQLQQIADLCLRLMERAQERKCEQTLTIVFNDRGLPRYFNGSDNVMAVKQSRGQ
jgi:hypothetical protein